VTEKSRNLRHQHELRSRALGREIEWLFPTSVPGCGVIKKMRNIKIPHDTQVQTLVYSVTDNTHTKKLPTKSKIKTCPNAPNKTRSQDTKSKPEQSSTKEQNLTQSVQRLPIKKEEEGEDEDEDEQERRPERSHTQSQETMARTVEKVCAVAVGRVRGIIHSEKVYIQSVKVFENQKSRYFMGQDCIIKATEWLEAQKNGMRTTSERREYQAKARIERLQRRAQQPEKELRREKEQQRLSVIDDCERSILHLREE